MLRKKAFRDIKNNFSQFITIFLMVFLGVFVFAGVHAYMDGMKQSGEDFYESNNLQDIWIAGKNFSKEDLEDIKKLDNIKDAERELTLTTTLDNFKDVTIEANFIESNNISKMYVVDGEGFEKDKEGIWFDSYLAKNLNLKVGDEISLSFQNYKITEKIVGLVNVPDHVYSVKNESELFPTHKDFGFGYMSINQFPEEYIYDEIKNEIASKTGLDKNLIENDMISQYIENFNIEDYYVFNTVLVDVDDTSKINDVKMAIENNIESAIAVTDRDASASCEVFNSEIEEGSTYSSVFTLLFLFIAVLSVITTMRRFVKKQRVQIGTLKALGVKNRKIVIHYMSYGFYISLLASILALIVGRFVLGKFFLEMEMSYFEVPVYSTVTLPIVYVLATAVIAITTIVTYLSCRKVLKQPAVEALRLEIPKVKKTNFDLTTKGIFKKASLSTRWNLRDIGRNKSRTAMGVVGVVGCTMLIVCALGMLDTMNSYLDWQFSTLYNFKYKLSLETDYTDEEYNNLVKDYGDATSQTLGIEFKKNNDEKEANTIVINDAKEYLKTTGHNREYIDLKEDGVYLTEKLASKLNLKVGDDITWHAFGDDKWYTTKIIGLNREPQNQTLTMSRKFAEEIGLEYKADSIYTNEDLSNVKTLEGVELIQNISALREGMESMLKTVKMMVVLLVVVSIILGCVIIYNLGILSFSEKQYQFATLKVLGFNDKQIKKIFVKQNTWITTLAIIIGLPLGFLMTDYIFKSALGDNYDFNAKIRLVSYIYSAIGTFLVSILVNRKLSNKVKTIDMVSSLKANE